MGTESDSVVYIAKAKCAKYIICELESNVKTDILLKSLHDKITPLERKTWSLKCDHWRTERAYRSCCCCCCFFFQLQPFWQNEQIWENKFYCKYYEHDILYTGFQSFRFTPFALVKGCTLKGGTLWFFLNTNKSPRKRVAKSIQSSVNQEV